jgi:quinol monooxygenase YgiN
MMHALLLKHKTLPGKRAEVEEIWREHMISAVDSNKDHLVYVYNFGQDDDEIWAFQVYQSKEAASEFLSHPTYLKYLEASRPLLAGEPIIEVLDPRWIKGMEVT